MRKAVNKNAPSLMGWMLAAVAGLVAFVALVLVGKFDFFPAAALAAALVGGVGMILGMPWGAGPAKVSAVAVAKPAVVTANAPVAPVAAAPVKEAVAQPAALMSAVAAPPAPKAEKPKAAKPAGPERLKAPRKGMADDLKVIEGIGPALEKLVNSLGFYHFEQIASWSDADVALVDAEMKTFKGRIARDKWVAQAKLIGSEGLEAFLERAKTNDF